MRLLQFAFACALIATTCRADQFFLKDAKGKQYLSLIHI